MKPCKSSDESSAAAIVISSSAGRRSRPARGTGWVRLLVATLALGGAPWLHGQRGAQPPAPAGPKLAAPTAFPAPGSYPTTESVTLMSPDPEATIRYTWDGSAPTARSLAYDPQQVLFIAGIYEGDTGLKAGYTLRAVAMRDGFANSDVATFQYVVDRRDRSAYVSEEILTGVRMIRDSDNDKMFLVQGTTKFALIDSGQGRGNLKAYLAQYTRGLPIEVIFTHNHGDHIGQADQFVADSVEHIGEADRAGLERTLKGRGTTDEVIAKNVVSAHDGDRIDLGDRTLVIHDAPGHTAGSIVILDEKTGNLFSGDSFGSNSPTIPDALWMQGSQQPLDTFLAMIKTVRAQLHGKVTHVMTGHNDKPLAGEKYVENLQNALQSLMDKGDAALVPSFRPTGLQQVTIGDRQRDPDWVAINVNKARYLPAPVDQIAGLTLLGVEGAALVPAFSPNVKGYTATLAKPASAASVVVEPTSMRSATLTINGAAAKPGQAVRVPLARKSAKVQIHVTSPDGSQSADYVVTVSSP
jgi:glyoxylase-like metal-dependent hydrolase (beta-lactamase superfamily II)